jgi:hypothetical protein
MATVKFADIKEKIRRALNEKEPKKLGIDEKIQLIDGFVNLQLDTELSGNITVGGPRIPTVSVLGVESGRIYFFALKALLPEQEI